MSAGSCEFDLCSDCARKNNEAGRKNECRVGHQLSPISVNTDGWGWWRYGWRCKGEECGYEWSPDQEQDQDVVVWRCNHHFRKMSCPYTGTTLINKIPWGNWPADAEEPESDQSDDSDRDSDSCSQHSSATEAGDLEVEAKDLEINSEEEIIIVETTDQGDVDMAGRENHGKTEEDTKTKFLETNIEEESEEEIIQEPAAQEVEDEMALKKEESEKFITSQTGDNKRKESHAKTDKSKEKEQADAEMDDAENEEERETTGPTTRAVDNREVNRAASRCYDVRNCCNIL